MTNRRGPWGRRAAVLLALILLSCLGERGGPEETGRNAQAIVACPSGYTCREVRVPIATDTYVTSAAPYSNYGLATALLLDKSSPISFVSVDTGTLQGAVGTSTIVSAALTFAVTQTAPGSTKTIAVYPLTMPFTERSGTDGATWHCARDKNVTDSIDQCSPPWDLDTSPPFGPATSSLVFDAASATLQLDVTADAAAFVGGATNNGWALRVLFQDKSGGLQLGSRESSQPGELVLTLADPTPVAPPGLAPPSGSGVTRIYDATQFLYTGATPVQTGVSAGAITGDRAAVLRGTLRGRASYAATPAARAGATVRVLNHTEFGSTLTQSDGSFNLAVNGGATYTVVFEQSGWLTAQRTVTVPRQDYVYVGDVVLVPLDSVETTVTLGGSTGVTAVGSVVSDGMRTRRPAMYFPPGLTATAGGVPRTTLYVRQTEFTVGPSGPDAMPATLPAASAYTYALELSAAATAGGTPFDSVTFATPAWFYVENFLGFLPGQTVPAGYYNRAQGAWVTEASGRVMRILSISPTGRANIDVTGDNVADEPVPADTTGDGTVGSEVMSDDERQRLASLYPGATPSTPITIWRVPINHFSIWDLNWGFAPPPDAVGPNQSQATADRSMGEPNYRCGSVIECENQTLGESVPLTGTPFALHYRSDRVSGYTAQRTLRIPLTGATLPTSLEQVVLEVSIAGRRQRTVYSKAPNLVANFGWDGRDAYGRLVQGAQQAEIAIGYEYPGSRYQTTARFGSPGAAPTGDPVRQTVTLWQRYRTTLEHWSARTSAALGNWTLSAHHAYDPMADVLHTGDGQRRTLATQARLETSVGNGNSSYPITTAPLALQAPIGIPTLLAVAADGRRYFQTTSGGVVYYVDANENVRLIPMPGTSTQRNFANLRALAVGPDGALYATEDCVVTRTTPGTWTSVVVLGSQSSACSTGSPVIDATPKPATGPMGVQFPTASLQGLAVGDDGTLYVAEATANRLLRVTTDGNVSLFAGNGSTGPAANGVATAVAVTTPSSLAIGADGRVYAITNDPTSASYRRVVRVDPDGSLRHIAGGGSSTVTDGAVATNVRFDSPSRGLAVSPDGTVYLAPGSPRKIFAIGADGLIRIAAGTGIAPTTNPPENDNGLARTAALGVVEGLAFDRNANVLYAADRDTNRVRRFVPPVRSPAYGNFTVPSSDGTEAYIFDATGRHLRTENAMLVANRVRYQFNYDSAGRLTSVLDVPTGLSTTITRDASGNPTAIVGPFLHSTGVALDANGNLASVTHPGGETNTFGYVDANGLLNSFTDRAGGSHTMRYDALGRLAFDSSPDSSSTTLARLLGTTAATYVVRVTSAEGRVTTHTVPSDPSGVGTQTDVGPNGRTTTRVTTADNVTTTTTPDGTTVARTVGGDPRWGSNAPMDTRVVTNVPDAGVANPALVNTVTHTRTTALGTVGDPLTLTQQVDTVQEIGPGGTPTYTTTQTYNVATRTLDVLTAAGRRMRSVLDTSGREASIEVRTASNAALFTQLAFTYDTSGRLETTSYGTGRTVTHVYNPTSSGSPSSGLLEHVDAPMGLTTSFTYGSATRLATTVLPNGDAGVRSVALGFNGNSALTSLTPPGRTAHGLGRTPDDLLSTYSPPYLGFAGDTVYQYNHDHQLTLFDPPGVVSVAVDYDSAGRPWHRVRTATGSPTETTTYAYNPTTGLPSTITAPDGGTLTYAWQGALPIGTAWSGGGVTGSVARTYDWRFNVTSRSVTAGGVTQSASYTYDADNLLTSVGGMTVTPHPDHGMESGTSVGSGAGLVTTSRTYNLTTGWLETETVTVGTTTPAERFFVQYGYDNAGRITQRIERVEGGAPTTYDYRYDGASRLQEVGPTLSPTERYSYDANGNRLRQLGDAANWTYDAQDRLTARPTGESYTYRENGELRTRVAGGVTRTFDYDERGSLRSVGWSTGMQVSYALDGVGRRVARSVTTGGTTTTTRYLYEGRRIVAELDGSNNLVSRFVYGTRSNVPDLMVRGGVTYRIVADHLGSVRLVIDTSTGAVVQRMRFNAYGVLAPADDWAAMGFARVPFGFAGGLYDRDTGLVRFGARDYDPEVGRWVSKDETGFGAGLNFYEYAGSDPVDYIDATGHYAVPALIAIALAIILAPDDRTAYTIGAAEVGGAVVGAVVGMAVQKFGPPVVRGCLELLTGTSGSLRLGSVSRPLTAADLGLAESAVVEGSIAIRGSKATAMIRYLGAPREGLRNGILGIRRNLVRIARESGATSLRIETTRVIEETGRLAPILGRAGFQARPNGTMWWEGPL